MKKIFLFSIILTISLHAIEQPSSSVKPDVRISLGNIVARTFIISGALSLGVAATSTLTDSRLKNNKLHIPLISLTGTVAGIGLIGEGYILRNYISRNKEALLKGENPPLNNEENGLAIISWGLITSLLSVGPALKNTHHLGMEHLALIAGIIGVGVGVKVYNTDASKQVEEFAR
jgi:hypothetical protein